MFKSTLKSLGLVANFAFWAVIGFYTGRKYERYELFDEGLVKEDREEEYIYNLILGK